MIKQIVKTELIKEYMQKENIKKTEFCRRCKISPNVYKKIIDNQANYSIHCLFRISRILDIHIHQLFAC